MFRERYSTAEISSTDSLSLNSQWHFVSFQYESVNYYYSLVREGMFPVGVVTAEEHVKTLIQPLLMNSSRMYFLRKRCFPGLNYILETITLARRLIHFRLNSSSWGWNNHGLPSLTLTGPRQAPPRRHTSLQQLLLHCFKWLSARFATSLH